VNDNGGHGWRKEPTLLEWFTSEPWDFEFFEAMRLLERLRPDAVPLAEGSEPDKEPVRLRSNVSLAFPAAEIQGYEASGDADIPPTLTVNLMGLAGHDGPLPVPDTELTIERALRQDTGMRDFLDIFHHRLLSLLVRLKRAHHPAFSTRSPDLGRIAQYLYSLFGLGLPQLRNRMNVPDRSLLYYAGILARQPRPASGLGRILADYFGVAVEVRQLTGQWRRLEGDQWLRLGRTGQNQVLGRTALLGTRYWDQAGQFEVELGPMDQRRFADFLPGAGGYVALCALTRFYAGPDFEFTFGLIGRAGEAPAARLDRGSALGWTSWLKRPKAEGNVRVRLRPGGLN
jgi:type VI secretion system protein ImpH